MTPERAKRPAIQIIAVCPEGKNTLPQELVALIASKVCETLAQFGFTQNGMGLGPLSRMRESSANLLDKLEQDSSEYTTEFNGVELEDMGEGTRRASKEIEPKDANKTGEAKVKASKITVEDVTRGLKLD